MTRLWPDGTPVHVDVDSLDLPIRFVWAGEAHRVRSLQQSWQVHTDWWEPGGPVWRTYFALTTTSGLLCVLFRDENNSNWFLSKLYD